MGRDLPKMETLSFFVASWGAPVHTLRLTSYLLVWYTDHDNDTTLALEDDGNVRMVGENGCIAFDGKISSLTHHHGGTSAICWWWWWPSSWWWWLHSAHHLCPGSDLKPFHTQGFIQCAQCCVVSASVNICKHIARRQTLQIGLWQVCQSMPFTQPWFCFHSIWVS